MIIIQILLQEIEGPTCGNNTTFFEQSLACGLCPVTNSRYSQTLKRCVCAVGFMETSQPFACAACGAGQSSFGGMTRCLPVAGSANASSTLTPCDPGADVLVSGANLVCAPLGYINYNRMTAATKQAVNPCAGAEVFSEQFQVCYTNGTQYPDLNFTEAYNVCNSRRSSRACASVKNYCVLDAQYCADFAALVTAINRSDLITPLNVRLDAAVKQIRGYSFYIQVTNLQGNILYNGPFAEQFFSLCAYTKALGTNEFWPMGMANNSDSFPSRKTQFGFAQRVQQEDFSFQLGRRHQVFTQPFINNIAAGYTESCDIGVNQLAYTFSNQTLFFSMYLSNLDTIHVPMVEQNKNNPSKIRPNNFSIYNGSTVYLLAHYNNSSQSVKFAKDIKLDFTMNNSFRYSPILRIQYKTLNKTQFSFPQVKDQSPITQYLPRLFPVSGGKKIAFDYNVRNYPAEAPGFPLILIASVAIVTLCGIIIGLVQNCRGSGTGGISVNQIMLPQLKKKEDGSLEETKKCSSAHILDILWYLINYLGIGLNLYCTIYQLQLIFVREETLLAGIPDNLYIINLIGFVTQLFGYINAKIDDAGKSCLFVESFSPHQTGADTAESTQNSGWKIISACNRLIQLQKMHLGELELTSVTFLILFAGFDFFYRATPNVSVDAVFSIDKTFLSMSTAGIFSIIYLVIVALKALLYLFAHSPFAAFQEFLQSINLSLFMFDTPRSCVFIHGGVKDGGVNAVDQANMIDYCQQVFSTKSVGVQVAQSKAQVLRIYATNKDEDSFKQLSDAIELHSQRVELQKTYKISEMQVYGIQKYDSEVQQSYMMLLNQASEVQNVINTLGDVEIIGFPPYFLYDIPRGMTETEPRYFKYEKQFSDQSWFYRNPKFKNQFWYEEWIQEMSFLNSFMMFLTYWIYNQYLCVIIVTAFLLILDFFSLRKFKQNLAAVNCIQPNFLDYF